MWARNISDKQSEAFVSLAAALGSFYLKPSINTAAQNIFCLKFISVFSVSGFICMISQVEALPKSVPSSCKTEFTCSLGCVCYVKEHKHTHTHLMNMCENRL